MHSARVFFRAGKNREGYFGHENFISQVKKAVDIFEERMPGRVALFAFDNATTHQKRAEDALSARHMPRNPCHWKSKFVPKEHMRAGMLANGSAQNFYYPEDSTPQAGMFKGMAKILEERGYNTSGLRAECPGFKCADLKSKECCCRHILFNEPDFKAQKSAVEEYIESRGHKVIFYPKFHCELNFIEQVWGRAKYHYRMMPCPRNEKDMEQIIKESLESVPLDMIHRCGVSLELLDFFFSL